MKKSLLFLPLLGLASNVAAQELRGVVTDADNNPLVGASVYWAETTIGASTSATGAYTVHRVKNYDRLVASYLGYVNDTIRIADGVAEQNFRLRSEGVDIEGVVVESTLGGNYVKRDGILKGETISFAGLCKMACCNLAESFENSASVTVGYSDAISGARQIKMLGLAGTYTQILDENRPIMRGLSAPYGLSYTPGMWLNSIQVSKGVSSVTAGHEAITGQINLEHRKPTDDERLFVNLYFDDELKPELNLSTALPVTRDKKLTTIVLAHGSMDTKSYDHNHDGFRDLPEVRCTWPTAGSTPPTTDCNCAGASRSRPRTVSAAAWATKIRCATRCARARWTAARSTVRRSATEVSTATSNWACPSVPPSTTRTSRTRCVPTSPSWPISTTSTRAPTSD